MQLLALLPARLRWPTASQSARSRSRSSMCISSVFEQLQDVPRPARVFAIVAGMGTAVGLAESILKCEARATLAEVERVEHEIIAKLGHYSPQIAPHYTGRASQKKKLALSAAEKLQRAKRLAYSGKP